MFGVRGIYIRLSYFITDNFPNLLAFQHIHKNNIGGYSGNASGGAYEISKNCNSGVLKWKKSSIRLCILATIECIRETSSNLIY